MEEEEEELERGSLPQQTQYGRTGLRPLPSSALSQQEQAVAGSEDE